VQWRRTSGTKHAINHDFCELAWSEVNACLVSKFWHELVGKIFINLAQYIHRYMLKANAAPVELKLPPG